MWTFALALTLATDTRAAGIFEKSPPCDPRLARELLVRTSEIAAERRKAESRRAADVFMDLVRPQSPSPGSDPVLDTLHAYLREDYAGSERAAHIHLKFKQRFGEMPNHRDVTAAAKDSRLYEAVRDYHLDLEIEKIKDAQRGLHRFGSNMEVHLAHPRIRLQVWQLREEQSVIVLNGDRLDTARVKKIEMFENQPYGVVETPRERLEATAGLRVYTYRDGAKAIGDVTAGDSFIHLDEYGSRVDHRWVEGGVWTPASDRRFLCEVTLVRPVPFFVQGFLVESKKPD